MDKLWLFCLRCLAGRLAHPSCHALAHALLEGGGEGSVAAVAALRDGEEVVEGLKADYSKAVPHYLMYTTIGRADLIEFELAAIKRHEVFKEMMEN